MDTAFNIIVIILSSFLAIFLVLGISVFILILKLVSSLRSIVAKGEHLVDTAVDSAEEVAETFRRNANAVNIVKIFANLVDRKHK